MCVVKCTQTNVQALYFCRLDVGLSTHGPSDKELLQSGVACLSCPQSLSFGRLVRARGVVDCMADHTGLQGTARLSDWRRIAASIIGTGRSCRVPVGFDFSLLPAIFYHLCTGRRV